MLIRKSKDMKINKKKLIIKKIERIPPIFPFIITIDGNIKSGKTILSKYLSEKLNFKHLDFASLRNTLTLFLLINFDLNFFIINDSNYFPKQLEFKKIMKIKIKYKEFQKTNKLKYKEFLNEPLKLKPYESLKHYIKNLKYLIKEATNEKINEILNISFNSNCWFINNFNVNKYIKDPVIIKYSLWFLNCKIFKKLLDFFEADLINLVESCPYGSQGCSNKDILHYRMQGIISEGYNMSLDSLKSSYFKIYIKCKDINLIKNRLLIKKEDEKYLIESIPIYEKLYEKTEENILKIKNIYLIDSLKFDDKIFENILFLIKERMKELNYNF